MYSSRGSTPRTVRAAIAVMFLGGVGLAVPPLTPDMLALVERGRFWPATLSRRHRDRVHEPNPIAPRWSNRARRAWSNSIDVHRRGPPVNLPSAPRGGSGRRRADLPVRRADAGGATNVTTYWAPPAACAEGSFRLCLRARAGFVSHS
jgi:hypothetical protein